MTKRSSTIRHLALALVIACAPSAWAAPVRPTPPTVVRPERHGPRPDPQVHIILGISTDARPHEDLPYAADADGRISIAPPSPSEWDAREDIAANTFTMTASMHLPRSIASADVAHVRAVVRGADRRSVSVETDDDMTEITISGTVEEFGSLTDVELVQLIVEQENGMILVQDMSVGLKYIRKY